MSWRPGSKRGKKAASTPETPPSRSASRAEKYGRADLPPRQTPVGSRTMSAAFFDSHPGFLATSETSATADRLNLRYEAIFAEHAEIIAGRRVLDISSHDGRWSFAALAAGAEHVVGIEARPELVERSRASFAAEGVEPDRYEFLVGDVFDVLSRPDPDLDIDVVLCLGFLYHTLRYNELLKRIRQLDPGKLIIDTEILPGRPRPLVQLVAEDTQRQGNAVVDEFTHGDTVLVGVPSVAALRVMARAYGFELERESDWTGLLEDNPGARNVGDYRARNRATLLFSST